MPPRADLTPRSLRTLAIDAKLVIAVAWIARIAGSTVWANSSAAAVTSIARPRGLTRRRLWGLRSPIPLALFAKRAALEMRKVYHAVV